MTIDTVGDMKQAEYDKRVCERAVELAIDHLYGAKRCLGIASIHCDNYTDECWFKEVLSPRIEDMRDELMRWMEGRE